MDEMESGEISYPDFFFFLHHYLLQTFFLKGGHFVSLEHL